MKLGVFSLFLYFAVGASAQVPFTDCNKQLSPEVKKNILSGEQYAKDFFEKRFGRKLIWVGCQDSGRHGLVLIVRQDEIPSSRGQRGIHTLAHTVGHGITIYYDFALKLAKKKPVDALPKLVGAGIVAAFVAHLLQRDVPAWNDEDIRFIIAGKPQGYTNEIIKRVNKEIDATYGIAPAGSP